MTQMKKNNIKKVQKYTNFFIKLKQNLINTKKQIQSGIVELFKNKKIDNDLFKKLEDQLIVSDVGVYTTKKIIDKLILYTSKYNITEAKLLHKQLYKEMELILTKVEYLIDTTKASLFIILVIGVNGTGKTTTIGKLSHFYKSKGKKVMLAAGDTFRAAGTEQLQIWGNRNNIPVIISEHIGADPASVIFNAIKIAKNKNNIDILIADTAGRLHNKNHLMEELKKIKRVIQKLDVTAPHEVMLVLDSNNGQNTLNQVKTFNNTIKIDSLVFTKLDGSSKGGIIFSVADRFEIPISYISIGEELEDLRPFNAKDFIKALSLNIM